MSVAGDPAGMSAARLIYVHLPWPMGGTDRVPRGRLCHFHVSGGAVFGPLLHLGYMPGTNWQYYLVCCTLAFMYDSIK